MAMTKQLYKNDSIIFRTIEELVPMNHLVRKLDECMDFTFIYDKVENLYNKFGRASIPPVVLFKLIIINKVFGINSMRRTWEEVKQLYNYDNLDEERKEIIENEYREMLYRKRMSEIGVDANLFSENEELDNDVVENIENHHRMM